MTSASMPSTPAAVSLQQGNQMAPTTTGGATSSAGQFEHITVMTSLQQTPEACTEMTVSSAADGGAYAVITTTSAAGLQIYPPSAITQQVQQSTTPALSRGGATKQLASIAMTAGDDGPTVRQHLQQQHKVRLQQQQQQQLALQERMKSDKVSVFAGLLLTIFCCSGPS
ncbi:unnamed protein product [Gongylonema pulchrum]|uniref:KID domain-containing protein n=1 Tax=Gongylonema pulchrum TaxID=637853 RepID=A0A183DRR1_9BILA|nr:unnamed protein product [Gongylonema pulchrum]